MNAGRRNVHRSKLRGQAATEFLIVFPVLIFLAFGIVQWALIYQARATLNHAALLAARAGAMNNGDKGKMRQALAAGLTPLFTAEPTLAGYATARAKAFLDVSLPNMVSFDRVNPTPAAMDDFGEPRLDGKGGRELPNDTMVYRNPAPGPKSGVSVQDANILHLKVNYCYRMIVPVVGRLIQAAASNVPFNYSQQAHGMSDPFGIGTPLPDGCNLPGISGPRIRIQSEAIVRMQSPFFESNL